MTKSKKLGTLALVVVASAILAVNCWAQAQDPQQPQSAPQQPDSGKPKPAARGVPGLINDQNDQDSEDHWQADTSPVTGLITPTLGTPESRHSYWVPGAEYGLLVVADPFGGSSTNKSTSWYTTHYLGGNLSLVKAWTTSVLKVNYSGGGVFSNQPGQGNGTFQQVAVSDAFQLGRWRWQWADQFAYLPVSAFGFGVGTGLGSPGVGGSLAPNTAGTLPPNQSVYSAVGPLYSNMALGQGTYSVTRRSSFTMAGMYSTLHFTQSNNIDNQTYLGNIGYNYALTKADSVGVMYRFSSFHFPGQPQAYGDSSVGVAYHRKITHRLGLAATAGPEFISYRIPIGGTRKQTNAQASASFTYALKQVNLYANYYHGLSAGAGVILGAELDQVTFGGSRQITRQWNLSGSFGFSKNRPLGNAAFVGSGNFDGYFAGVGANRPITRGTSLAVSYTAYIERVSGPCTGPFCVGDNTQHTITVFLNWHTRPFVIE